MGDRLVPADVYEYNGLEYGEYDLYLDDYYEPPRVVNLNYLDGPHVSVAQVAYGDLTGSGDAKRNNGERRQPDVGRELAVGRALVDLGNQLIDRAYARLED